MIISLNIKSENSYYKIFEAVKIAFTKLNSNIESTKGRPCKYSDEQIVTCMLYGIKNRWSYVNILDTKSQTFSRCISS